jgi:hypothetical protein
VKQHIHNGQLVTGLMEAVGSGKRNLKSIPMLVKRIISDGMWREFYVDRTKQLVTHTRFADFVAAQPMEGLGADIKLLKRTCSGDEDALKLLDLIDKAETNKDGNPTGANQYQSGIVSNIHNSTRPVGTTRQYALRRLRTGRPDLHALVLDKKLSPHAAMIEAGYRVKSMTIPADPTRAAQYLKRHFTKTEFDVFKKELLT